MMLKNVIKSLSSFNFLSTFINLVTGNKSQSLLFFHTVEVLRKSKITGAYNRRGKEETSVPSEMLGNLSLQR